jgi:CRP-like cAMP-binding protein
MQGSRLFVNLIKRLSVPLFSTLDESDLALIVPLAHRRSFEPNQLVFAKGDHAEDLYIVLAGRMRISVLAPDGRELAFRNVGPGQVVGEIAVLDGGPRTADMTSVTQSEALALGKSSLVRLIEERPTFSRDLVRFLCERVRSTSEQLESIALYRIEARIARFLLELCESRRSAEPTVDISFTMSQAELGAMLGASRPKTNGALVRLEETGAIRRRGSRLSCHVDKLRAIAEDMS